MELDNPEWSVNEIVADNKKLVMRMGQLAEWDLDIMFDLDEIERNIIDDNNWIDFEDPDNNFTRNDILEYIRDFKNDIVEYAEDGEEKTQQQLANKIANEWEEILDDDLLKVILVKTGYHVQDEGLDKGDPIIDGAMTTRELQWYQLQDSWNWDDWRKGIERSKLTEKDFIEERERDAKKRKEERDNKGKNKTSTKYNIDIDEDEPKEALADEDADDEDNELLVEEWTWKGDKYLFDPVSEHVWYPPIGDDDPIHLGKRYKIDNDEKEQLMAMDMYEQIKADKANDEYDETDVIGNMALVYDGIFEDEEEDGKDGRGKFMGTKFYEILTDKDLALDKDIVSDFDWKTNDDADIRNSSNAILQDIYDELEYKYRPEDEDEIHDRFVDYLQNVYTEVRQLTNGMIVLGEKF